MQPETELQNRTDIQQNDTKLQKYDGNCYTNIQKIKYTWVVQINRYIDSYSAIY